MAKRTYIRICSECRDQEEVGYKPKGHEMCPTCRGLAQTTSMNKRNTKPEGTHIRYWYFCPNCPSVRQTTTKRKTSLCADCSRLLSKAIYKMVNRKPAVRHFRICPHCPEGEDTKQVAQKKNAGIRPCPKHRNVGKAPKVEVIVKSMPKPRKKSVLLSESAKAILREEREEHKKKMAAKEEYPKLDELDSKRMQEEFLRCQNVS